MSENNKIILKETFKEKDEVKAVDWLAKKTTLSKIKIKAVVESGGLWIRNKKGLGCIRRNSTVLHQGDRVEFYYDPNLPTLAISLYKKVELLYDGQDFSVLYKPTGMLSQESKYGELCSMSHYIKTLGKSPFIVQRLDRETEGVMIVAHSKQAAAYFSTQTKNNNIFKYYHAIVLGEIKSGIGSKAEITLPLDGKNSITKYSVQEIANGKTLVDIEIISGRYHQIRQHFNLIGHPLIGDPQYGQGNKNRSGLKLLAYRIQFPHPKSKSIIDIDCQKRLKILE
ncbi:MAG: hypothetical protein A2504_16595 [Bdellovibrionales bacterium RIFOXYD12_FULL_39_22]|nr:MAG: hypothetical protein A2385_14450 [Bdellovibrionales bacterium RIFOXYB1_FULL_39_21]OFZ44992.1 MAG: hypothetical protein A2485_13875 [Bdellovibrionales bacterium RIFOXYC12_FULL_39_17]OFZ49430.1 MAG: hypothetical protein A2404_08360 [Bdellovibrionales bacterium RIFOXYC1_FULL_39_130]OFZ73391.1 MAG: hypothetical protein A2451_00885 [Bdellovibrionales bacterium RIFOXYC2_FULL_39_8]OFZ77169.1 MAG: hypothetical protein A2560_07885 [Bdellovibrionales bacterium RIFOXYD1_FULL_39_84]OFZ95614.1 MAG: